MKALIALLFLGISLKFYPPIPDPPKPDPKNQITSAYPPIPDPPIDPKNS